MNEENTAIRKPALMNKYVVFKSVHRRYEWAIEWEETTAEILTLCGKSPSLAAEKMEIAKELKREKRKIFREGQEE